MFIIGEVVRVQIGGREFDAEILDITDTHAYVYIFDTGARRHVRVEDIHA